MELGVQCILFSKLLDQLVHYASAGSGVISLVALLHQPVIAIYHADRSYKQMALCDFYI